MIYGKTVIAIIHHTSLSDSKYCLLMYILLTIKFFRASLSNNYIWMSFVCMSFVPHYSFRLNLCSLVSIEIAMKNDKLHYKS